MKPMLHLLFFLPENAQGDFLSGNVKSNLPMLLGVRKFDFFALFHFKRS
ncbi:hypothetical protein FX988_02695 [Paraglaciecola mesophila]|uniref:Uncharacterized protein n=1 Tax=Paraglaciecola mesophila TaxID=197222 RepID=A0A857JMA1_9ALTE|nr:hypothetical protein FX988_02695 [Paraglaciecola mesophila]